MDEPALADDYAETATVVSASILEFRSITVEEAKNEEDLNSAAKIIINEYNRKGYIKNPETILSTLRRANHKVFVARFRDKPLATLSLIVGKPLPMDSIFGKELEIFRNAGLRIGEIGKLASQCFYIDSRMRRNRIILLFLAKVFLKITDEGLDLISINVHPTYVDFYTKFIGFQPIAGGVPRPLLSANGAPAVAMVIRPEDIRSRPGPRKVLQFVNNS